MRSTFVLLLKIPENIPVVNFYILFTKLDHQSIVSRTSCRSFITGISFHTILSSSRVINFKLYTVIIAFSIMDSSITVILPSMRFISQRRSIIALLNRSPGFSS